MDSILEKTIASVIKSEIAYSKYITANDTPKTKSHQSGFLFHKNSWKLFLDVPKVEENIYKKNIRIRWQDDIETDSCFNSYKSKSGEFRVTCFGRNFPYRKEEYEGALLIIAKKSQDYYEAFILNSDEDIDDFFDLMNMSPTDVNNIIPGMYQQNAEEKLLECFRVFIKTLSVDFPTANELSTKARLLYNDIYKISSHKIIADPDKRIMNWISAEYELFKALENNRYAIYTQSPFSSVQELINTANIILNRRKCRAGKSLELHLAEIFNAFNLKYETQAKTEGNKKPDFLFPGRTVYMNSNCSEDKLIMLAAKRTCKDRWRQILNEADRIKTKHLFTLQEAISANQLSEMYKSGICLVVPKYNLNSFPEEYRSRILTLNNFVKFVQMQQ